MPEPSEEAELFERLEAEIVPVQVEEYRRLEVRGSVYASLTGIGLGGIAVGIVIETVGKHSAETLVMWGLNAVLAVGSARALIKTNREKKNQRAIITGQQG